MYSNSELHNLSLISIRLYEAYTDVFLESSKDMSNRGNRGISLAPIENIRDLMDC